MSRPPDTSQLQESPRHANPQPKVFRSNYKERGEEEGLLNWTLYSQVFLTWGSYSGKLEYWVVDSLVPPRQGQWETTKGNAPHFVPCLLTVLVTTLYGDPWDW